jgi:hypothetical protein
MKYKLLYLLMLLMILGAGCGKGPTSIPTISIPDGSYAGQFRLIHRKSGIADTLKASITLTLKNSDGTFSVTGDTLTVHAGSHGTYGLNSSYFNFLDKTNPTTGTPAKVHLNGPYLYAYDGSILQMLYFNSDTLSYQYDLKKKK